MLIFDATTKSLEFKLGTTVTTNQAVFTSMWVDHTSSAYTPGTQNGVSNNSTAVTIVTAPGASTQRSLKYLNIYNRDTVAATVTVQYNDNTTIREMLVVTLNAKDSLQYIDTDGWSVIDTNGQKKSLASLAAGTNVIGHVITDTGSTTVVTGTVAENLTQVAGTAVDVNSGNKSAGTLRVILATDQPALTNKLLVTPDSVALPANQSVNIAQVAGTTTDTNSGNKSAGTLRVTLATDQVQLTNALKVDGSAVTQPVSGQVSASNETNTLYNGTTALTPKFSTIVASSSGATTIVALVSSKKLRVLSLNLIANAAVNVKWQSHVTPTDKTGLAYLAANGGYILPYNPLGWFETIAGEALDINLSGAVAVGGHLSYVEV